MLIESKNSGARQLRIPNNILKALLVTRVMFPSLLLLLVVFVDHIFLQPIFTELDILEHFLFGFIISEVTHRITASTGIEKWLTKGSSKENVPRLDLFVRLLGFLIVGGLLWESLEYFLFPMFGVRSTPFFTFPITLRNIDGTIDVIVGILGCILAWYTEKGTITPRKTTTIGQSDLPLKSSI